MTLSRYHPADRRRQEYRECYRLAYDADLETAAQFLTWGADEKLLLALAVGGWLYAVRRPALRPITDHILTVSLASAILPPVPGRPLLLPKIPGGCAVA
jgi:hypothetical protein